MSPDAHLLASARRLLAEGPLPEGELARRLYGAAGSPGPWLRLLDKLLAGREEFERLPDSAWSVRAARGEAPLLMAGRSTRARGGRLRSLALAPAGEGRPGWRWEFDTRPQLPGVPSPPPAGDEEGLVRFGEAAGEIAAAIAGRELLTLDEALFHLLRSELETCGCPSPSKAVRVLGREEWLHEGGKRSAADVRAALGLAPAVADELGGELELLAALHARHASARSPLSKATAPPRRDRLRGVAVALPEGPGVYAFVGAEGRALYVGSAKNLRRRVLSYFSEQVELTRGMRGLLAGAERLEHVSLGTHLEAVLEEAGCIARLQPPYNVQRRVSARAAWLRVGAEYPVNVAQVATAPRPDGALYLGPLPNREAVAAVAGTLAGLWGFKRRGGSARTCTDSLRRLEELRELLEDPERFLGEMRGRLHRAAGGLSPRAYSLLAAQAGRTERAVLEGELQPVEAGSGDALVSRYDESSGMLHLLLVREHSPIACARVPALDSPRVGRAVAQLLAIPAAPADQSSEEAALAARWLHAHRADPWAPWLDAAPPELAARLLAVVADHLAERERPREQEVEERWWE